MLTNDGFKESQTGRIEMTDLTEEGVKSLIMYMYKNELDAEEMDEENAIELIQAAHKYNIPGLEAFIVKTLTSKPDNWFGIMNVFSLYLFTEKVDEYGDLCQKMMRVLRR